MPNVSQVAKLLYAYLRHDLNFSQQVESVVATGNQSLYSLAELKQQSLGICALDAVFQIIILNKKCCMLRQFTMDT